MDRIKLLSVSINLGSYKEFIKLIITRAKKSTSSYVCVVNVHMIIEAWKKKGLLTVVESADIATPDGMPLIPSLKLLYGVDQERVSGMDLMPDLIEESEKSNLSIFFYGSTVDVLEGICARINEENPSLRIAGSYSPPFRDLDESEESDIIKKINGSGANIVMVALGCPKQEFWMARQRGKINAVMLGVGAAFPVYAGVQKRAPVWMQKYSMEWLFRLCQEPRRLFKRYFVTNTLFLMLLFRELLKVRVFGIKLP